MATFRKYGGTNFSQNSNIVRHNILNSTSSSFNTSGLYNSKETYLSHIDMSGNSLLHVGNIYFQDGTSVSTGTNIIPGLTEVLSQGNSAGSNSIYMNKQAILDLSYIVFSDNTILNTATGLDQDLASVLTNGNVASTDINMANHSIIIGGQTQSTTYTGFAPSKSVYKNTTITFDMTNSQILDVSDNDPVGLEDVLLINNSGNGLSMTNIGDITQSTNKIITQSGNGTEKNTLKTTEFQGNITQINGGSNILNDTSFNGICQYINSVSIISDNDIPNKAYVDTIASGLKPTTFCDCATTKDESLQLNFNLEVDGYPVQDGDRVLVKSQGASTMNNENTDSTENGIYVYNSSTGKLTRADDCNTGDNITNQYSFIENGSSNGLKAFIQTNTVDNFNPGSDKLQYGPFYSSQFQLGNGLEFVPGTPTTLQVKSNLDNFLNSVELINNTGTNGYLTFKDTTNISSTSTKIQQSDKALIFENNTDTTSNYDKNFKFKCNNLGNDTKQTIPLEFNSSSFSVDLSGSSFVKYEAFNYYNSNYDNKPIGHNFTGYSNFYDPLIMNSNSPEKRLIQTSYINYLNNANDPSYAVTQVYQGSGNLVLHNTAINQNDSQSRFAFFCNDVSTNATTDLSLSNVLQFNTNYFNLSLLTKMNSDATRVYDVRYEACSKNYYNGLPIGHNFTGNMNLKNGRFKRDVGYITTTTIDMSIILNYVSVSFFLSEYAPKLTLPTVDDSNVGLQVLIVNANEINSSGSTTIEFKGAPGQKVINFQDSTSSSTTLNGRIAKLFTTIKTGSGTLVSSYGWGVVP